ncbi:MAG: 1-(5-phosphoribosyl)-5-[(5-phosphoribosylamino)methylideneamino] imidazole-4-carboxamide isomerase [Alicyclobacillaceae bacterium]|jgi:phosphoribosylformimino-5-aminoimidazole carboxamide ribotide isomerase|nr:1-(5-phosphoribosyl)-5-[(5-phosphoribosylamino)methylideneamino] imidazole-4-carboxamide isomerase [Alicyclobacillaceae bacterium]
MFSNFDVFPALDFLDGYCVRLSQGNFSEGQRVSSNPLHTAEQFLGAGARWLHIVDLNAARTGVPYHEAQIAELVKTAATFGARVQVGGGVRSLERIGQWLKLGVARCIVGTAALEPDFMAEAVREFGADAVVAGLDGRDGRFSAMGWEEQTTVSLVDLAVRLAAVGVTGAIVTDVRRDGMEAGANLDLAAQLQQASGLAVVASGGVTTVADIRAAKAAQLAGVVVGKALYSGRLTVNTALAAALEEVAPPC